MPTHGFFGWMLTVRGRILFNGVMVILLLWTPWYVTGVVGVIGALMYDAYWELLFVGILMDALSGVWGMPWVMMRHTIILGCLFIGISILRKKLFVFSA